MNKTHMYEQNRKSINWFVGCRHNCVYCKPSFQRQAKRSRKHCQKHYDYEPHAHLEKLAKTPPLTNLNEFVFFPSLGDPYFASPKELQKAIDYTRTFKGTTFLMQSKNPARFEGYKFPDNVILGITLETDRRLFHTPSIFKSYERISVAPTPIFRVGDFRNVKHKRKLVTVEPILDFDLDILKAWIYRINPEIVYIGYDNHNCKLPEPSLAKTERLISDLSVFTEVRVKTLRKAWWENES